MRKSFLFITAALLLLPAYRAYSIHNEDVVTPYGGSCSQCGNYGTCNTVLTDYDAEKAIRDYYGRKGLDVTIEETGERFMKARISDRGEIVDIIIFDRKSGRIRSIY